VLLGWLLIGIALRSNTPPDDEQLPAVHDNTMTQTHEPDSTSEDSEADRSVPNSMTLPEQVDWRDPLDIELETMVLENEQLERSVAAPLDSNDLRSINQEFFQSQ
jgi:hypothetical protein